MKRWLLILGLVSMLVASIAACGDGREDAPAVPDEAVTQPEEPGGPEEPEEPAAPGDLPPVLAFEPAARGGTVVIGQGQEPETLFRYNTGMLAAGHVFRSLYDGPFETYDYDWHPVILETLPKLEEEGPDAVLELVTVEPGEMYIDPETQEPVSATEQVADLPQITVRFRLIEGVTWEDGTPVTAADSAFAYDIACHPDVPSSKFTCERTAHYIAVDERTAEWQGLPGFSDQTYFTNFWTPLPRHQPGADGGTTMADTAAADILEDEAFARKPYSYGPFRIEEWVSGDHITLVRNESYWRADEGLPFLDSLVHKFIPNANSLLAAAKSGEVDVATRDGLDMTQIDAIDNAAAKGQVTPHYVVGLTWERINLNMNPVDERVPVLACLEIRQAIAYGTDRQTMVDVILKGKGEIQHSPVQAGHWAYPPDEMITRYDFDPVQAERILNEFGFVDQDGDGTREAVEDIVCTIPVDLDGTTKDQVIPAGTPLEFEIRTTSGRPYREEATLLFQQNLANIGIDVRLAYEASNVFFADGPDGDIFGRRFDAAEYASTYGLQPGVYTFYCTEVPSEESGWAGGNIPGWCNTAYDLAGKTAENTIEREVAIPLYHEALEIFMRELPVIGLFSRVSVIVANPDLVNFAPNRTISSEAWNSEVWGFRP